MEAAMVSIQTVREADYESVADIYNEYILLGNATMEESVYDFAMVKTWVDGFSAGEKMLVLKNEKSNVIGWGVIRKYSERGGYRFTCETSVYLTSREIGKGYGTLLKKRLIEICKEMGYHHIVAKIWASNTASIAYNTKLGYEIVGIQKEIGYKNEVWVDVIIMQYLIQH